jgi:Tfp pilus assembly protein PilN
MNSYRVSFYFDTIEEAESEEQALEQAEEFFETGLVGIRNMSKHFSSRAEVIPNKVPLTVMDRVMINLKKQK